MLELYQDGVLLARNDNWKEAQPSEVEATGLAPADDLESALVATLAPGAYTFVLQGQNGGTGVGLLEAYDLDPAAKASLANTSTRGFVQTGDDILIAGFIIGNGGSDTLLVKAIGPSLATIGISNPLADPTLELYDANGAILRSDDDWRDTQESLIRSTSLAPSDDAEAAIIRALAPGHYTAVVRGKDGGTGVALVEVYNAVAGKGYLGAGEKNAAGSSRCSESFQTARSFGDRGSAVPAYRLVRLLPRLNHLPFFP